jgi:hypothetical protein
MRSFAFCFLTLGILLADARSDSSRPPEPLTSEDIAAYVDQLGSGKFSEREQAERSLTALGDAVLPSLKTARDNAKSAEVRSRLDRIIGRIDTPYSRRPKPPRIDFSNLPPTVQKKGRLKGNERWTSKLAYHVTGDLVIPPETTLRIDPGTFVFLDDGVNIRIEGERSWLYAESDSPERPIMFTSLAERHGKSGNWGRIEVNSIVVLKNVQIRGSSGILVRGNAWPQFTSVGIYETRGDALRFINARSQKHCDVVVREATGNGVVFEPESATSELSGFTVSGVERGVLALKRTSAVFTSLVVEHCRQVGVVAEPLSSLKLDGGKIRHCPTGIDTEHASGMFNRVEISNCQVVGMSLKQKSYPTIDNVLISDMSADGIVVTGRSYPVIGHVRTKNFKGRKLVVAPDSRVTHIEDAEKLESEVEKRFRRKREELERAGDR